MSEVNLIESLRRLGFPGSDKEAEVTLNYIGLPTRELSLDMTPEGLKRYVARNIKAASIDLNSQLGSGHIEFTPDLTEALVGLSLLSLNGGGTIVDVLIGLKTAALQSLAEEEKLFNT